jgi:hypothetical protein
MCAIGVLAVLVVLGFGAYQIWCLYKEDAEAEKDENSGDF